MKRCTKLTESGLMENNLTGLIPVEIGNLVNLETLRLSVNQIAGTIPTEIGSLANLWGLYLNNNQLTGSIPVELGNLTKLRYLSFGINQLSGAIPNEFTGLSSLEKFYVHYNDFVDLPDLSSIASLNTLQIQSNKFTFEDIEPNVGFPSCIYAPQDSVGTRQDTTVMSGSSLTLSVSVGGSANQYQ